MKKLIQSASILFLTIVLFSSCSNNTPPEAKYIPKDASFVLVADPNQMKDKIEKGGISMDTLIERIFKGNRVEQADRRMFQTVRDSAGIDWERKMFVFQLQKNFPDNSQSSTISILGGIKDKSKMETFLKKQEEFRNKEIQKGKEYSYIEYGDGSMIAWDEKVIISSMYTHFLKPVYDTIAMTFKKPDQANVRKEMKEQVDQYFSQKENESMAKVDVFTGMFKEKADGYVFTSANSTLGALSLMPLQIPKLEELLKDNYATATLNFEDGKIIAKSTSYTNPVLSHILKQYAGPTVNLSLIEHYPSNNINGIVMASFNPEIFSGILKQLEVEGIFNSFLEKSQLSKEDIYKSFKGDIAVVVSDLGLAQTAPGKKTDERNMIKERPIGKMLFNAPVGDRENFEKLLEKAREQGFVTRVNNVYKASGLLAEMGLFVMADGKNLIIASDSLTYQQYISGNNKATFDKGLIDQLKNKSTVMYFDITKTLEGFSKDTTGDFSHSMKTARETFKDLIASSDNFDGKGIKASFEINMMDRQQNSLVTLIRLFSDIAIDYRLQARKEKELSDKAFQGGVPAVIRTN